MKQPAMVPPVLLSLSLVSLVSLGGCLGGTTIACDYRPAGENRCHQSSGLAAADPPGFEASCERAGGVFRDGPCPRGDAVAACDRGSIEDWYYPPATVAEVTFVCDGEGSVFVP